MPERVVPGPVEGPDGIREAVCIHTKKIYDSCRDKDCLENLRFYPKLQCVDVVNRALTVKGGTARLLHIYVDVEPVSFNRGFYTVDLRFFYCVTLQAYLSGPIPVPVEGLCVFDKRVILFGSEGNAKIFSSEFREGAPDPQLLRKTNLPVAVAEAMARKQGDRPEKRAKSGISRDVFFAQRGHMAYNENSNHAERELDKHRAQNACYGGTIYGFSLCKTDGLVSGGHFQPAGRQTEGDGTAGPQGVQPGSGSA